ncbi:sugar transferase [Pararhodonellum marinum]|uniref:sugar transferase n=1 Tax=Pararhodonellum marinum TaxID=2755358 RepID=UPI00188EED87|nr:sugar transferase [Pararhodonellum marinum]
MSITISKVESIQAFPNHEDFIFKSFSINLLDASQIKSKRIFDVTVSFLLIIFVGSWLFPLIVLLIKLDSKGPAIFKQLRHGQGNVPFLCFKFRSMKYDPNGQFIQATKGDPRVTRVGKFLRKTSLDELPQLFNVLMGDMSLVGPRPFPIKLNQEYSNKIGHFMYRHVVKPGITGLAQSKGFRGEIKNFYDMDARLKYDLFYIKQWSFLFDFVIIFWTVNSIIFNNKNAY